jgi:hypothetical protein
LGKKGCSPRQLNYPFPQGHDCSLGKSLSSLGEHMFQNVYDSYMSLYKHATYHWKGFKESHNFVVECTSIRTHMQNLCSCKVLDTFVPWGNMVVPHVPGGAIPPWEQPKPCFPKEQICPKLLCGHNFCIRVLIELLPTTKL